MRANVGELQFVLGVLSFFGLEYAVPRMGYVHYVPLAPMIVMRRKVDQAARTWESRRRLLLDLEIAAFVDRWRRSFPYDRFFLSHLRIYHTAMERKDREFPVLANTPLVRGWSPAQLGMVFL